MEESRDRTTLFHNMVNRFQYLTGGGDQGMPPHDAILTVICEEFDRREVAFDELKKELAALKAEVEEFTRVEVKFGRRVNLREYDLTILGQ